jgi:hypothetical protein
MLDPSVDFASTSLVSTFTCKGCGRNFSDWQSCHSHTNARKHGATCKYDHSMLPSCLNAHEMLPVHRSSGYCDIQGRRQTFEDFHAIHFTPTLSFYGTNEYAWVCASVSVYVCVNA